MPQQRPHHSEGQQCQKLNPLSPAEFQTQNLMDTSQVHYHWAITGTPKKWSVCFFFFPSFLAALKHMARSQSWPKPKLRQHRILSPLCPARVEPLSQHSQHWTNPIGHSGSSWRLFTLSFCLFRAAPAAQVLPERCYKNLGSCSWSQRMNFANTQAARKQKSLLEKGR